MKKLLLLSLFFTVSVCSTFYHAPKSIFEQESTICFPIDSEYQAGAHEYLEGIKAKYPDVFKDIDFCMIPADPRVCVADPINGRINISSDIVVSLCHLQEISSDERDLIANLLEWLLLRQAYLVSKTKIAVCVIVAAICVGLSLCAYEKATGFIPKNFLGSLDKNHPLYALNKDRSFVSSCLHAGAVAGLIVASFELGERATWKFIASRAEGFAIETCVNPESFKLMLVQCNEYGLKDEAKLIKQTFKKKFGRELE